MLLGRSLLFPAEDLGQGSGNRNPGGDKGCPIQLGDLCQDGVGSGLGAKGQNSGGAPVLIGGVGRNREGAFTRGDRKRDRGAGKRMVALIPDLDNAGLGQRLSGRPFLPIARELGQGSGNPLPGGPEDHRVQLADPCRYRIPPRLGAQGQNSGGAAVFIGGVGDGRKGSPTGGDLERDGRLGEGIPVLIQHRDHQRLGQGSSCRNGLPIPGKFGKGPGMGQNPLHVPHQHCAVHGPGSKEGSLRRKLHHTHLFRMAIEGGCTVFAPEIPHFDRGTVPVQGSENVQGSIGLKMFR